MSEGTETPAAPTAAEPSASADALGNFEHTLDALEALVEQLESGDLSLEAALGAFEQGIALTRQCQKVLSVAEQRVRVLLEDDGALRTEPLSPSDAP